MDDMISHTVLETRHRDSRNDPSSFSICTVMEEEEAIVVGLSLRVNGGVFGWKLFDVEGHVFSK